MRVQTDFSALKSTRWYELAVRFLLGGLITAATGLVAKKYGPSAGGLFLAFPAIFPASATLLDKHEKEKKQRAGFEGKARARQLVSVDAAGAAIGSIGLLVFALCTSLLMSRYSASLVLLMATLLWIAVSVLFWHIRKRI